MATVLAFGFAANFEKATGGSPEPTTRNGHKVLKMDVSEDVAWRSFMSPAYSSGSNLTLTVNGTSVATSGTLKLQCAFERFTGDLDSDSFDTAVAADADPTVSGTSGTRYSATWTLANGAIDDIVAGEFFRLKILRISSGNTMTGDFELWDWAITQ